MYVPPVFTYQYECQRCGRTFFRAKRRGGKQFYCDECAPVVARERTAERVRKHREKIEQSQPATVALLGGRGRGSERERGGLSSPSSKVRKSSPSAPGGGMFADWPVEIRNEKRRALGLPALAF